MRLLLLSCKSQSHQHLLFQRVRCHCGSMQPLLNMLHGHICMHIQLPWLQLGCTRWHTCRTSSTSSASCSDACASSAATAAPSPEAASLMQRRAAGRCCAGSVPCLHWTSGNISNRCKDCCFCLCMRGSLLLLVVHVGSTCSLACTTGGALVLAAEATRVRGQHQSHQPAQLQAA